MNPHAVRVLIRDYFPGMPARRMCLVTTKRGAAIEIYMEELDTEQCVWRRKTTVWERYA